MVYFLPGIDRNAASQTERALLFSAPEMQIGLGGAANWSANREFADFARPRGNNPESVWQKARAAFNLYPLAARYLDIEKRLGTPQHRSEEEKRTASVDPCSQRDACAHFIAWA